MNKKELLENQYGISIEKKDTVYYVYFKKNLLFLAPSLDAIQKSMEYKKKQGE